MRKLVLFGTLLGMLFTYSAVFAQEGEVHDALEVSFITGLGFPGGGITNWNNALNADNGYKFGIDIGYFLTESWLVGFDFTYNMYKVDHPDVGNLRHRIYSPRLYAKFVRVTETNFEPYAKAHIGIDNPKFTTDVTNVSGDRYREISYDPAFSFGATAGMFYYTSDYSGLFFEAEFHRALAKNITAVYQRNVYDFNDNYNSFDLNVGVRILIGSGG